MGLGFWQSGVNNPSTEGPSRPEWPVFSRHGGTMLGRARIEFDDGRCGRDLRYFMLGLDTTQVSLLRRQWLVYINLATQDEHKHSANNARITVHISRDNTSLRSCDWLHGLGLPISGFRRGWQRRCGYDSCHTGMATEGSEPHEEHSPQALQACIPKHDQNEPPENNAFKQLALLD